MAVSGIEMAASVNNGENNRNISGNGGAAANGVMASVEAAAGAMAIIEMAAIMQ
jgi:hypothetical protein